MPLEPGSSASVDLDVGDDDTAIAMHSGSVPCLATPRVIALSEEACILVIEGRLADGATTVGQRVQVGYPVRVEVLDGGGQVPGPARVRGQAVQGRRLTFTVSVNDDRGLVAVGRVTRVIVDTERFLDKLN